MDPETTIFHRLSREDLGHIAEIQVQHLRARLAERDLTLTLTAAAKARLSRDGYDPAYGARPLKRLIRQEIENPLARRLLGGHFGPGDAVVVDTTGEVFTFEKGAEAAAATVS